MAFADFCQTFSSFCWVHLVDGWTRAVSEPFIVGGGDHLGRAVCHMTVSKPTSAIVTIQLPDKRAYDDQYTEERYGGCRLELIRLSPSEAHIVSTEPMRQRDISTELLDLEAGEYMLLVWASFPEDVARRCVASVYASEAVILTKPSQAPAGALTPATVHTALSNAHLELARRIGTLMDVGADSGVAVLSAKHPGGNILLIDNERGRPNHVAHVKLSLQLDNLALLPPDSHRPPSKIMVDVPYGQVRMIRLKPLNVGAGYKLGQSLAFSLSRDSSGAGAMDEFKVEAKQKGKKSDFGYVGASNIAQYFHQYEGGIAMVFENGEADQQLELELSFNLDNLKFVPARRGRVVKVTIGPGESDFILLVKVDRHAGYSFGYGSRALARSV